MFVTALYARTVMVCSPGEAFVQFQEIFDVLELLLSVPSETLKALIAISPSIITIWDIPSEDEASADIVIDVPCRKTFSYTPKVSAIAGDSMVTKGAADEAEAPVEACGRI
jgi:hypothetical protein